MPVAGHSLTGRAVMACVKSEFIGRVYVTTDDREIAEEAVKYGASVIERPAELSTDTASSESALLHAIQEIGTISNIEPKIVVFVQATSPFIRISSLDEAIRRVSAGEADVVFSGTESHQFHWSSSGESGLSPLGHPLDYRPRRQDRDPVFAETGAFYVMRKKGFVEAGYRFFGTVAVETVPVEESIDIDTVADLSMANSIANEVDTELSIKATRHDRPIEALVTDFDGVHTDDKAYLTEAGMEIVRVSRADGLGIELAKKNGIRVLILSKERNKVVAMRARKLGVEVLQAQDNKEVALKSWCTANSILPERVMYVGNDVNDIPAFKVAGLSVAVADARYDVKKHADLVLSTRGGDGAVREAVEMAIDHNAKTKAEDF